MPDNSALVASLLLGQRQRASPYDIQRKYGQSLLMQGASTAPVQSPLEGLARALTGAVGGYFAGQAVRDQKEEDAKTLSGLANVLGANTPEEMQTAVKGLPAGSDIAAPLLAQLISTKQEQMRAGVAGDQFATAHAANPQSAGSLQVATGTPQDAIGGFESGNDYSAVNPKTGAAGKYQVLPSNVGPWTKQYYGQELSVPDFLRNPKAQEAVFNGKFVGEYLPKYGPQGARAAWFAGEGGMNNPNARDANGVSVAQYVQRTGGGAIPQGDAGQPASAASAPPEVPRPQPTPDQIKRYRDLIATGQMTAAQAENDLNKELTTQWQQANQRAMDVWKEQNTSRRQTEGKEADLGKEIAIKTLSDFNEKTRPQAIAAVTDIQSINQMRQLLDQGVFSGTFAPQGELAARAAQLFGINLGADAQANTAALRAAAGGRMGAIIKQYGSGTGISDADIRAATARIGGDTTQGEEAIRKILDVGEREARKTLSNYGVEVGRLRSLPQLRLTDEYYAVPNAPSYADWQKENPAIRPAQPQAPQPQGQGAVPPPDGKYEYRRDPATGKLQRRAIQ